MALVDFQLQSLPRSTQLMIFGGLAVALIAVAYFFYLEAAIEELEALEVEVEQLETEVAQATAVESQLKRFKSELAQLQARLDELSSVLPAEKETPIVVRSVQQMASSSNLLIKKFEPQPEGPREFFTDVPILLELQGSYNSLGLFFEKISRFTRIVNVDNITVTGMEASTDPMRTLTAVCTAITFIYRSEEPTGEFGTQLD